MNDPLLPAPLSLFEADETAWLEQTAALVAQKRFAEIDRLHLSEYLTDMARRDKREVFSRLVTLLTHLLKWRHQSEHRTNSGRGTILEQRRELRELLESGALRRHADERWDKVCQDAVAQAAAETGLSADQFAVGDLSLEDVLSSAL